MAPLDPPVGIRPTPVIRALADAIICKKVETMLKTCCNDNRYAVRFERIMNFPWRSGTGEYPKKDDQRLRLNINC